jgi:isopenicillin N synthase-like dioxygenase
MTSTSLPHDAAEDFTLPLIDLGPFLNGTDKYQVAAQIREACLNSGFFYITGHGIPEDVTQDLFETMRTYFALPKDEKLAIDARHSHAFRGYFPLQGETLDPDMAPDLKEGFDMGRHISPHHIGAIENWPLHAPNRFPEKPEGFATQMQDYYDRLTGLGQKMMRLFAISLELEENHFDEMVDAPFSILRLLHYPPQQVKSENKNLGAGAHTDYGCFTILANDEHGGLEIQHTNGEWISVPPRKGCFVVNISDMMQRWTNDTYRSTWHRVVNLSGQERYSIPFFFDPNHNARIACLPTCCSADNPPGYEPISAGEYLLKRLAAAF